jgi:A/G-specific adenine glycosylase
MDLGATVCTPRQPACPRCPLRAECAASPGGEPEAYPVKEAKRQGRVRRGAAFVVLRDDGCVLARTRPANGLLGGMTEVPTTEWTHDFNEEQALADAPALLRAHPLRRRAGEGGGLQGGGGGRATRRSGAAPSTMRRMFPLPHFTGEDASESRGRLDRKPSTPHPGHRPNEERAAAWRRIPGVVRHVFTHFPLELAVFIAHVPADAEAPAGMRWIARAGLDGEALPNLMRKVIAHATTNIALRE